LPPATVSTGRLAARVHTGGFHWMWRLRVTSRSTSNSPLQRHPCKNESPGQAASWWPLASRLCGN